MFKKLYNMKKIILILSIFIYAIVSCNLFNSSSKSDSISDSFANDVVYHDYVDSANNNIVCRTLTSGTWYKSILNMDDFAAFDVIDDSIRLSVFENYYKYKIIDDKIIIYDYRYNGHNTIWNIIFNDSSVSINRMGQITEYYLTPRYRHLKNDLDEKDNLLVGFVWRPAEYGRRGLKCFKFSRDTVTEYISESGISWKYRIVNDSMFILSEYPRKYKFRIKGSILYISPRNKNKADIEYERKKRDISEVYTKYNYPHPVSHDWSTSSMWYCSILDMYDHPSFALGGDTIYFASDGSKYRYFRQQDNLIIYNYNSDKSTETFQIIETDSSWKLNLDGEYREYYNNKRHSDCNNDLKPHENPIFGSWGTESKNKEVKPDFEFSFDENNYKDSTTTEPYKYRIINDSIFIFTGLHPRKYRYEVIDTVLHLYPDSGDCSKYIYYSDPTQYMSDPKANP